MGKNELERDPVCGMKVDLEKCNHVAVYGGKEYHFCTDNCKEAFKVAPEKYIGDKAQKAIKGESVIPEDPVCGMKVDRPDSHHTSVYKGKEYYFCSEGCKKAFDYAPEKYVSNRH